MAVVCIAGINPGIGKTSVAEMLLDRFQGWHAVRVRVGDDVPDAIEPTLAETGFTLSTGASSDDPDVARMLEAGAVAGTALYAEPRGLEKGLGAMGGEISEADKVLVEGNGYLWAAEADLTVMVIGPRPSGTGLAPVKRSVRSLLPKVDMWVWNTRKTPGEEGFYEFPQALARMGLKGAVTNKAEFHHVNPTDAEHAGNEPFLEAVDSWLYGPWWKRESDRFLRRIGFDEEESG